MLAGARPGRGRAPGPTFVGDFPRDLEVEAERLRHGLGSSRSSLLSSSALSARSRVHGQGSAAFIQRTRRSFTHLARSRPRTSCTPGWPASVGRIALRMSNPGPPHAPLPCFAPFFDSDRVVNHGPTSGERYHEYEKKNDERHEREAFNIGFSL